MNRRWLKITLAFVALAVFAYVGRSYFGDMHRITDAHWLGVLGIALIHVLTLALQGWTFKCGLDALGESISDKESFHWSVFSSYANLLVPRSGFGTLALYLKKIRNTALADFGSVLLINAALFAFSAAAAAVIVLAISGWATGHHAPGWLLSGLTVLLVISGLAVSARWTIVELYRGPGCGFLHRLGRASAKLVASGNVWRLGVLHVTMMLLRAWRLQIAFWALSIDVNFSGVLLASVLGDLAFVIAVTPTALGFREAAIAFAAAQLGTSTSLAVSTAVFDRLVFSLTVVVVAKVLVIASLRKRTAASPTPRPT